MYFMTGDWCTTYKKNINFKNVWEDVIKLNYIKIKEWQHVYAGVYILCLSIRNQTEQEREGERERERERERKGGRKEIH
jgi:hypothetical protein